LGSWKERRTVRILIYFTPIMNSSASEPQVISNIRFAVQTDWVGKAGLSADLTKFIGKPEIADTVTGFGQAYGASVT
jgi:hypothetical protein